MRTGWLWYGVTLLPVTGLVQVGHQAYAERYAYVPLMGIYVIVAWSAGMLAERGDAWRRAAVVTSLAALLAFGSVARQQLHHWHDSIALFTRGVEISPESGVTHHNLAVALLVAQRVQPAQQHFELAIEVEPQNPRYLNNLGRLHQLAGRPLEAVPYHERAIAVGPRNAIGKNLLGQAWEAAGRLDRAIAAYEAALEVRPGLASAIRNLERARKKRAGS